MKMYFQSILIALFLVIAFTQKVKCQTIPERVSQMKSYRLEGYFAPYLKAAIHLDSTVIEHPYFNLCILEAALLTGNDSIACSQLNRRIQYNADLNTLPDSLGDAIKKTPCYEVIEQRCREILNEKIASEIAFELSDSTIHPESIVYDTVTKKYFISSVRHRAVYTFQNGSLKEFIPSADKGIGAVLGLDIDSESRVLYVTSAHIPEMENYDTRNAFRNTILKYHLDSEILIERNDVYDATRPRLLSEIKVASDGTAFITDSYEPVVLKWNSDNTLEEFIRIPKARSLQGLAFDESTGVLFIADYSTGIYAYDLYTGFFLNYWNSCGDLSLKGIDGLYLFNQKLIGIQNGTVPQRIIEVDISDTLNIRLNVLENNIQFGGEPTNGVIHNDSLMYISNSPWPFYSENQPDFNRFRKGAIRKVKL
jgi:hypothetical protein